MAQNIEKARELFAVISDAATNLTKAISQLDNEFETSSFGLNEWIDDIHECLGEVESEIDMAEEDDD